MLVAPQLEVFVVVVEDRVRPTFDVHLRVRQWFPAELQDGLLHVVVVEVTVTSSLDEVADIEVALLGHHLSQQCIARDVEGYAEEDVSATLVELTMELATSSWLRGGCDVELEKGMTGFERHLVKIGHIPGTDDDAARVRVLLEQLYRLGYLVDMTTVRRGPGLRHCTP